MPNEKSNTSGESIEPEPELVTWRDMLDYLDRLRAKAPHEFEGFMEDRDKSPPSTRDLFEGWEE